MRCDALWFGGMAHIKHILSIWTEPAATVPFDWVYIVLLHLRMSLKVIICLLCIFSIWKRVCVSVMSHNDDGGIVIASIRTFPRCEAAARRTCICVVKLECIPWHSNLHIVYYELWLGFSSVDGISTPPLKLNLNRLNETQFNSKWQTKQPKMYKRRKYQTVYCCCRRH